MNKLFIEEIISKRAQIDRFYREILKAWNNSMDKLKFYAVAEVAKYVFCLFNGKKFFLFEDTWTMFIDNMEFIRVISACDASLGKKELSNILYWLNILEGQWEIMINIKKQERVFIFKNGVLDILNEGFVLEDAQGNPGVHPFIETDTKFVNMLPIDYIQYEYETDYALEAWDNEPKAITRDRMNDLLNWFAKGNEQELENVLTMMGVCMNNIRVENFFYMFGKGGSGKSTLLSIITQLVGIKKCVSKSIGEFESSNRFKYIPLIGKNLLYSNEVNSSEFESSFLKEITTPSTTFSIEYKGMNEIRETKLPLNIVLCSNHKLKIANYSSGDSRRMVLFSFPYDRNHVGHNFKSLTYTELKSLQNRDDDDNILWTTSAIEAILEAVISATRKFLKRDKKWKWSSIQDGAIQDTIANNNNVVGFVDEYDLTVTYLLDWYSRGPDRYISAQDIYDTYKEFCMDTGLRSKGKNNFIKELVDLFAEQKIELENRVNIKVDGQIRKCLVAYGKDEK